MAQSDMFLKIPGIPGESNDEKHKDEIDVLSFSWGQTNTGGSSYGGGAGTGRVQMQDFHFTMKLNKATPKLMQACAIGKHIDGDSILVCRKAGGGQKDFLKIKFTDIVISSYQTGAGGGGDAVPTEQISFNYSKVDFEYFVQDNKGDMQSGGRHSYDQKTNKST